MSSIQETTVPVPISVPEETTRVEFNYVPALDGVRAIAVLAVLLFHARLLVPSLDISFKNGFLGVDIFFVLSGFLITSILLKEFDQKNEINFRNFYMRRFLRLMPAYWLHLGVLYFFAYSLFTQSEAKLLHSNGNFVYSFLYLSNWQRAMEGSEVTGLLSHTWSLAIEEQFYLIWAGLLFLMLRYLSRRAVVIATASLVAWSALMRFSLFEYGVPADFLYNAFNTRMDALLIGCLAGQIVAWKMVSKEFLCSRRYELICLLALMIAVLIFFGVTDSYSSAFLYRGGLTLFALAVGVLIIWFASNSGGRLNGIMESRPMVWIGKTSYGIYLWHGAAIAFVASFHWPVIFKLVAAVGLTLAVTAISYYLLEKPCLRLKHRFK